MPTPQAALIEIVERTDSPNPRVIVPNEVRINGVPVLVPIGESIRVHEVAISNSEIVRVTLTLYARRIVVGTEPKAEAL